MIHAYPSSSRVRNERDSTGEIGFIFHDKRGAIEKKFVGEAEFNDSLICNK